MPKLSNLTPALQQVSREFAQLRRRVQTLTAQRDAALGRAKEYKAAALRYQRELVAARRALRGDA